MGKREKIYRLLKSLVDSKVPITGVGMQGYWKQNDPSPELLCKALDEYSSLGLKIQITELDITIRTFRPPPTPGTTDAPVLDAGFTPELEKWQAD